MKRVAAITGARRGIGNEIAKKLASNGYSVILSDIISREEGELVANEINSLGYDAAYIPCDISSTASRKDFFEEIRKRFGRLELLVNNAGVAPPVRADVLQTTEESFDFVMNINLRGTYFMCQAAANIMIELCGNTEDYKPRIINISSMSAYTASVNRGEYCVSKAGNSMITALFAARLAEYGIPVFEIRPGIIMTDMTAPVTEKYQKLIDEGITPIKRFGTPGDVADCVLAASGGLLDFATGQVLNADGGFHIRRL